PPYTTRSSGRSATSGSRLFWSIRYGASVSQERQLSAAPRGARTVRDGSWRTGMGGSPVGGTADYRIARKEDARHGAGRRGANAGSPNHGRPACAGRPGQRGRSADPGIQPAQGILDVDRAAALDVRTRVDGAAAVDALLFVGARAHVARGDDPGTRLLDAEPVLFLLFGLGAAARLFLGLRLGLRVQRRRGESRCSEDGGYQHGFHGITFRRGW